MIPERYKFLLPVIIAIILLIGVQIGYYIKGADSTKILQMRNGIPASTFDEVIGIVQSNYIDTLSIQKLQNKAIVSFLQSLDPHSTYFPPSQAKAANDELMGHFGGIGIEFALINDTVNVVRVIPTGPSAKSGLQVGDKILKVNDRVFTGSKINTDSVMHNLRGDLKTTVKVKIIRNTQFLDKIITRGQVSTSSIYASYMATPKAGYIGISEFTKGVSIDFVRALDSLKKQGMTQLVIDLRGNPGGLLDEAVKICDELLDENKLIVYTQGRAYAKEEYKCKTQGDFEDGKVILLVDELSASASEIVAGAMQDWERATIVGRRTFGKGLVQNPFALSNGGSLHLTIARYYTPSGRCIQRSYANGNEAYYQSITERVLHNNPSVDSLQPGSDTTHYYTLINHKPVFAGGGIVPDVKVNGETGDSSITVLSVENIKQAAFIYYVKNNSHLKFKDINALENDKELLKNLEASLTSFLAQKHLKINAAVINRRIDNMLLANYSRWVFNDNAYRYILNNSDKVYIKALSLLK